MFNSNEKNLLNEITDEFKSTEFKNESNNRINNLELKLDLDNVKKKCECLKESNDRLR